jgi:hypothetical protein
MASIQQRGSKFRVRIRSKGLPMLSLSFSSYEETEEWIEKYEEDYICDPDKYQRWIKANRQSKKSNEIYHVHIPLEDFKS